VVTILVTGATGGIGRGVVPLLAARGAEVVASGRDAATGRALEGRCIRFVAADLVRDDLAPLLRGVSVVVHLAALSSPWGSLAAFEAANLRATARLLEAAAAAGVARFVHASTPAIFAERRHRLGLRADSPPAACPVNHYARTKLAAERLVMAEGRMATLVLRPSAVLGPHDRAILPRLLRVVRRGLLPVGNKGVALFHPTDARDTAEAFAAAALGTCKGAANIAGRDTVGVVDMARALAQRLGIPLEVRMLPEPVLHVAAAGMEAWGALTGREPPMTRYGAAILSWSRSFDLSGTEALLGWRPLYGAGEALDQALAP
jgi:nucleoside-diphosphate-sugar epimerase